MRATIQFRRGDQAMADDTERIQRIKDSLQQAGLDAVVVSLPANVLLLTGYWPVVGTSIAVATRHGEIQVISPGDELELAQQGWAEVHTFTPSSLDKLTDTVEQIQQPLVNVLRNMGLQHGRIGYEQAMSEPASYAGMMIYGPAIIHLLDTVVPGAIRVSATETLSQMRAVKTARELECIRRSCTTAKQDFEQGFAQLQPGLRETEVAALFREPATVQGADVGSRASGFLFCMSGPNSAKAYGAYARSRSRKLQDADPVLVHCNSCIDGYWTDITRTYSLGPVPDRVYEMREAVFAARAAALAAIRPGVKGHEVDNAARQELEKRGFAAHFKHSTGHGVGFAAIDHNARPRLHPKSHDGLENGMVFNLEPAIYIEGFGGIRHCDMVAVKENRAEVLSDFQTDATQLRVGTRTESERNNYRAS